MTNPLAILDRPKFQFNSTVVMGMAGRYGIVRQGRPDHCINRAQEVQELVSTGMGHVWQRTGRMARRYTCAIGRKG